MFSHGNVQEHPFPTYDLVCEVRDAPAKMWPHTKCGSSEEWICRIATSLNSGE